VLDNFNAVEAPVSHGGDWVSASPPNPASDGAKVTGSTGVVAMWNHSFARPIENYITILAVSGFTYTLFTGMSTAAATGNGYKASYAGSNTLTLSRIDSGTPTTLLSLSVTFAQNDVVGLLLETGGKLTAYKNGVPIGSVTDTTYSGAGYTGFAQNNDMDNYGGGTSVVTKPIVPATINGTSTLSGGVIKAPKNITPATSIAATSTVAASVAAQKLVKGGNINAVSSLSGRVSKLARVGGAILANSTLGGIVAALKLIKPATINCVSATTGILSKLLIKFIAERGLTETTDTVSSTLAITVNANCTAGNTIFAIVGARIASSTTSWSAADSRGNTWHLDVLKWDTNRGVAILSTKQDVGTLQSGDVVTITFDVVPTGARMGALEEFAGLISSPLDKTATDSSPTLVTSGDTGATATISKVPELAITALITLYNAADTYAHNQSGTVGTYIAFPSDPMIENDSSAKVTMYAYQIIQSVAAQEEFMSFTPNGSGFAAVIATYKGIVVKLIVPATINALGAVSVTSLTALRAIRSASVSAVSTVSANVTANKLVKGGNIAATSTMSGSVAKQFLLKPANINAVSTVAASVKALRAIRSGAINAVSSLSITRLSALRAILPAQINCLLSASGSVAKKFLLLPATINAVSSASGRVNKLARISGAINAVLTVSGTVAKLTKITGAINCVSTLSANIRALRVVRPAQINCLLTVSGSVGKIFKLPTVSINCTSTLSGNISGKHAIVTSQINCLMTVTGDLVRPKRQISGAINCLMTVGGYVSRVFKLPTATVTCTSTLSGRTNKLASISGAINCAMTTSGSVRALKLIKPSQINAVSTLSGALHMQRGILPSQITCTSTLSGRIVRQIRLVPATINCATTVSAFINTAGHKPLTGGAINCASTLSGNLRVLRAVRSANVTCTSSLAANVTALRRVGGAVINCNTTVSGHVVMQRVLVAAQINSHTVVIATIIVKRGIVGGVITGQSTVSVRLSRLIFVVPGVILCTTLVFGSVGRRSQFSEIITGRVVTNIPLGKTSESSIGNIGTPSIPLGRVSTNSRGRVSSGRPGRAS
jgi:hypothetical protein